MVFSKLCLQKENACLLVKWQLKYVCQIGIYLVWLVKPTNCNILSQEDQPQMGMVDEQG